MGGHSWGASVAGGGGAWGGVGSTSQGLLVHLGKSLRFL